MTATPGDICPTCGIPGCYHCSARSEPAPPRCSTPDAPSIASQSAFGQQCAGCDDGVLPVPRQPGALSRLCLDCSEKVQAGEPDGNGGESAASPSR